MLNRSPRVLLEVVAACLVALVLLAAFAVWRIGQGPIQIGFIAPYVEDFLRDLAKPMEVDIAGSSIAWVPDAGVVVVRADGVRVHDANGRTHAVFPEVAVNLSFRDLIVGTIAPTRIDLIGPRVAVRRDASGVVQLDLAGSEQDAGGSGMADFVTDLMSSPEGRGRLSRLESVRILRAALFVDDQRSRTRWRARLDVADLVQGPEALVGTFAVDVSLGERPSRFEGRAEIRIGETTGKGEIRFADLEPRELPKLSADFAPVAALEAKLRGKVGIDFDIDGRILAAAFDVTTSDGRLNAPELWPKGLPVRAIAARGNFSRAAQQLAIEELRADLGSAVLTAKATVGRNDESMLIDGEVAARGVPINALGALWPENAARNGRNWIVANLRDGTVEEAGATARLRIPRDGGAAVAVDAMKGTMRMSGATVRFLDPMPPVRDASATVTFGTDRFDFAVKSGRLDDLRIPEGTLAFTGLEGTDHRLALDLGIQGPLRDALNLLAHPRLDLLGKIGIDPAKTAGTGTTRLTMRFPLIDALKFDDIAVKATSTLRDVTLGGAFLGRDVTDGAWRLQIDQNAMTANGDVRVAGVPAKVVWNENFTDTKKPARTYRLSAALDAAGRQALGFDTAPYLTGSVAVDLDYRQARGGAAEATATLGLERAALALAPLNWSKPAGTAGKAAVALALDGERLRGLRSIEIDAGGLVARGSFTMAADGKAIAAARLDSLKVGETDVGATLARRPDGGLDVAVEGARFDAGPLIEPPGSGGKPMTLPPMRVAIKLGRALLGSIPPADGVSGTIEYDGRAWSRMNLAGTNAAAPMTRAQFVREGTADRLTLTSTDGGATVRGLGLLDNIHGGNLKLSAARPNDAAPWDGRLDLDDFNVVDVPSLARLFEETQVVDASGKVLKGSRFSKLEVPFKFRDQKVTLEDARAVGSDVGMTGSGGIDLDKRTIALDGTIVPAYGVNSLLGNLPIIGTILTGEKGSGVFAATYTVSGALDDPKISVNPLAAITPGILRKIFSIGAGGEAVPEQPRPKE